MLHYVLAGEYSLLALHQHNSTLYPFLLESVAKGANARFSILFAYPQQRLASHVIGDAQFLTELQNQWQQTAAQPKLNNSIPDLYELPFKGGWFVYLGYEMAQSIEPVLRLTPDVQTLPLACAVRIPVAVIVDHQLHKTHVIAEPDFAEEFNELKQMLSNQVVGLVAEQTALQSVLMQEDAPERFIQG